MVIAGGMALPLVGCDPPRAARNGAEPPPPPPPPIDIASVREIIGTISMVAHGAEWIGNLIGLRQISVVAGVVSKLADFADGVAGILQAFQVAEAEQQGPTGGFSLIDWVIPPAHAQAPPPALGTPGRPPASLSTIPFLSGQSSILVNCRNTTETDFLLHNVFTVIRPVGQPRPMTAQEVMYGQDTQSFALSMPANGSYQNPTAFQGAIDQGYATYSWCIPSQLSLTDDIVQREALVGPIFYNVDPNDTQLIDAVRQQQVTDAGPVPIEYELMARQA